ncbi:glycoside hydrolase family 43 protein [Prolixibacteraceae bacterium Z1-6]|uniref:Glycoside hydrolase family 43 protein n=1 Tax=Draconibacterium aestuarii TaxID=2998507 RepID=A0A9X3J6B6_9BACT|nr:glycoside hydrolase family 43 protein [Prolixibacteraceae bacterium Z1-6]
MKITQQILLGLLAFLVVSCCQESKTIKPGEIWPDNNGVHINAHGGGVMFYEGKYYWFGEHKIEGKAGNRAMVGVHCYSSKNLVDWKDEGIALEVVKDDPDSDIAEGCILERPKVIYNPQTQKFVMWFHLELKGKGYDAARSGVAVADQITGPYQFVKSHRPNAEHWPQNVKAVHKLPVGPDVKEHYCGGKGCLPAHPDTVNLLGRDFEIGQMARDQNLFVDDDGKAYHIYSSEENSTLHISQLSDDFLTDSGNYIRVFSGRYMEAPAMFKYSGKYFLIASDCTGWDPNAARLAWAPNIFGLWEELANPCIGEDANLTFHSQSTFILPVNGKQDAFIYMGDRWIPDNAIDGRYIWLPLQFNEKGIPYLEWMAEWSMDIFNK